jgi:hypothetical protein
MARIEGVEAREAGWFVRLVYAIVRRKFHRVMLPVKIMAHHPRLLRAMGEMEQGQGAAHSVDAGLKALASLKTAMLIGCPF